MSYQKKSTYQKKPVVKVPRQDRNWSALQQAVFAEIENGNGNLQVDAKAGSGKTATLVECTFRIPNNKTILCCAFNNSIQQELEARVKDGCITKTMHSIGFAALRYAYKNVFLDDQKLSKHILQIVGEDEEMNEVRTSLAKAVNFCKFNLAKTYSEIQNVIYNYKVEVDSISEEKFIEYIIKVMESTKKQINIIDYADMIWLPVILNLSFPKYDFVFVDEAQDLNKCQIEIALRSVRNGGRICSLGDEWQAIYSFAGADSQSIPNIVSRLRSKRLPLSISYRCPKSVIEKAKEIVPDIEYAPNAKDGAVICLEEDKLLDTIKVGDVILSRTNAKLISWCMKLLKNKVPANIVGRDIASGIISFVKKSKANSLEELEQYVNNWRNKECEKLAKIDKDCSHINDKADCILALVEECDSVSEVLKTIEELFSDTDSKSIVTLSSVHRFKGRENNNIFVISSTLRYSNQEEKNIAYVAFTRSLDKMYLVS